MSKHGRQRKNSEPQLDKTDDSLIVKEDSIEQIGRMIQNEISKKIDSANNTPQTPLIHSQNSSIDIPIYSKKDLQKRIADSDTLSTRSKRFLTDYLDRLEELKWIHSRSSEYYERHNLFIIIPSIILTSVSGIISFMSTSNGVSKDFQYISSISVGVIASVSSLFQALSSTLQFNTKSELHRDVADRYDKIITNIKFEFVDHSDENFISELEKQIIEVQNMCKYFPPMFLYDEYIKFKKHEMKLESELINKSIWTQTDSGNGFELTDIVIDGEPKEKTV
jgi:hypothetical protein